jgi:putative ABC transport system permease protein
MTIGRLASASLIYYWRTHAAVALGVAAAVAVLAGSFIIGDSVRESLRSIATSRLGRTSAVVASELPFTEGLADRLASAASARVTPLLSMTGTVRHESSSRRAGDVLVYAVDRRFFEFHGVVVEPPTRSDVLLSPDLARELEAAVGDAIVLRVARPTDVPLDSLHGRRDEGGRSIRMTSRGVLPRAQLGSFSLSAGQAPVRAVFVPLARLQRDLDLADRVNTILVSGDPPPAADRLRSLVATTATPADLGLKVEPLPASQSVVIESTAGLLADALAARLTEIATTTSRSVTPVLTWLANRMIVGDRSVPYSLVAALGPGAAGDEKLAAMLTAPAVGPPPIVLNAWTAKELGAAPGAMLDLEFYRWADEGRLVTERAQFRVAGVMPMSGLAVDRRLAPDYPGITSARNFSDWDPPFPIDLSLVRKQDEDYWDQYRTAPKAFIPLAAGQSLWRTRHGQITSLRVRGDQPIAVEGAAQASAISVVDVRLQNLAASVGATDFGAYFSYFSFFLMVSALLLAALFFRLSIEQRLSQVGVLRALGFSVAQVNRVLLLEGALISLVGGIGGVVLALAWAKLMVFGLTTWWVGAIGTSELTVHVRPLAIAAGAIPAGIASVLSIYFTVRALSRTSPRAQIAGALPSASSRTARMKWLAPASLVLAAGLSAASVAGAIPAAAGFFGAGALVLVGGLGAFRAWLSRDARTRDVPATWSVRALGVRNAAWRPGRSLTASGLVAAAVFLLVSVDSFRKHADGDGSASSGTGGFAIYGESQLPIAFDLQSADGRQSAGLPAGSADPQLAGVGIHSLRLRPGEDTSCLNLYQPKQPRILGIPERLIEERRFRFARVIDTADAPSRENPWRLLGPPDSQGRVPAIVDQTSLQYVLHAAVGDVITIDAHTSRPVDLHVVASLDDSVLQGEILIGDRAFQQVFPGVAGYRAFLVAVDGPGSRAAEVSALLEESLEPFGFDAQSTAVKLESFHRVENTYLSTFQALGGLGLVLGCLGLVAVIARNVLERRRELALLGAAGFSGRDLQQLVAGEHIAVLGIGIGIGLAAAAVAIAPILMTRASAAPWLALIWLLPVTVAGLSAAYGATRSLRRLRLIDSLRSE